MANSPQHRLVALTRSLPHNHLIGAIDTLERAHNAVDALVEAGYPADDIILAPSEVFVSDMEAIRRETNRARQAVHVFLNSSDAGFPGDLYLEQARQGRHILHVYAATEERAERAAQILAPYHPHSLRYFGPLTVIDFPSH